MADQRKHHYTLQQAILLQSLATWLALNIKTAFTNYQEMAVLASTDELTEPLTVEYLCKKQSNHAAFQPCSRAIYDRHLRY